MAVKKAIAAAAKKLYPKKIPKDLARRAKDIGERFKTPKALKDHAKKLGLKDVDKIYRRKEGRKKLIDLVAQQERATRPSVWKQPVTARQAGTAALDVATLPFRAVTALGGVGSRSIGFGAPIGTQTVPATAKWLGKGGRTARFLRGGALVHGAMQAGKGGYLALGKGEKADAARREALREYGADAEFMGQKAADLKIGSTQNLLRAAEAGFLNPAESTYASVQAAKLMAGQSKDWEQEGLAKYNPFTFKTGTYTGPQMAQGRVRALADTDKDGVISEEERAAALEAKPTLGAGWAQRMAAARGAAGRKAYSSKLPPSLRSLASDDLFLGGAGDPEWDKAHRGSIDSRMEHSERDEEGKLVVVPPTKKFRDRMYGEEGQYTQYTDQQRQDKEETGAFSKEDRAAFLKAAKDGTLLAAFDVNDDGELSREEKKLFFDKEQGFKARRDEIMKAGADLIPAPEPDYPTEPAAIEGDLPVHAAGSDFDRPEYGGTVGELEEPTEAPEPPPTTGDYADMMRQAIDNEAIDIEERNEVMRTIRESMVEQGLTTPEQFNQIGRQMLEDSDARKAAAHVAYLRSSAGSDWVDTPGLDRLAALQKAPFGRGTALEGSVGKLTDESRQLESRGGRQRRLARELEGKGYRSVAGQVRAGAPRRPLMSQRDRIELEKKKKALAAEQAAAQALISEGEKKIETPTVS